MSARTSFETRVGISWYSAWTTSGAVCALAEVRTFCTSESPPACLLKVTWMSGCAAFHASTTLSMFGTQDQKVSSTLPPAAGAAADGVDFEEEQPATRPSAE